MQFTTPISILKSDNLIDYNSKIISIGSCFTENIGAKLYYYKFHNSVNPFGIIFNPVSIENLISRAINEQEFTENDIFYNNERWQCYQVHSVLSLENKEEYLSILNSLLIDFKNQILECTHFIITYGTSWIYQLKSSNQVVANCHKIPQNQFNKVILSVLDIENSIKNSINLIQRINPKCSFIFTVSPVRHIKDGFVENTLSKSNLIVALHNSKLVTHNLQPATHNSQPETHNSQLANYFPAYEIMMDELRDYRFYAQDMLHPNKIAIDFIWEKFAATQVSDTIYTTMEDINSIQKSLLHKPFNVNSKSYSLFLSALKYKIERIKNNFPHIEF